MVLIIVIRIPSAMNVRAYLLTGQDINPVHLSNLFLNNNNNSSDDSEIGDNAQNLSLSTLYYWLPLLLNKTLGIPLEAIVFLHALLGLPLLLLGIYALSFSLFHDYNLALLTSLGFTYSDYGLFRLNIGYPISFNSSFYYGDINHIFVVWSLFYLVRQKYVPSAIVCSILLLLNITYGFNLVLLIGFFLIISRRLFVLDREMIAALLTIAVAFIMAYILIDLSTPIQNPAPVEARIFAIQSYSHITPHVLDMKRFLYAQTVLIFALVYALIVECRNKNRENAIEPSARHLSLAVISAYFLLAWIIYFLLFIYAPSVFVLISPGKTLMICTFYAGCYIAYALYNLFFHNILVSISSFLLLYWANQTVSWPSERVWFWALSIMVLDLIVRSLSLLSALSSGSKEIDIFHKIKSHFDFEKLLPQATTITVILFTFWLFYSVAFSTSWVTDRNFFASRNAFVDIQQEIAKKIPKDAVFAPYRYPETTENPYGLFRNWPFRTYSQRGGITWVVGRNAYFNSAKRHQAENKVYEAAGVELWNDMLARAHQMKESNPIFYFTGIDFSQKTTSIGAAGLYQIYAKKVDEFVSCISKMTLEQYSEWAKRVGANYLIISRDKGKAGGLSGVLANDYFVVMDISRDLGILENSIR